MDRVHRALSLLLRGASAQAEPDPAVLGSLDQETWEELADRILEHRLAVSLAAGAAAWGMPEAPAARLAEAARVQQMRTHWLMLELHRVLSALQEAGTQPVVLKGAALVHARAALLCLRLETGGLERGVRGDIAL